MSEATSTNPVVQSIISGKVPPAARLAAARGLLPLPQADLLEALVHLSADGDAKVAQAAQATLRAQAPNDLLSVATADNVAPAVLGYLASRPDLGPDIHQAAAGVNGGVKVTGKGDVANPIVLATGATAAAIVVSNVTVDPVLANDIITGPAGFYFNVHSTVNGGGVIRGQLTPGS